MKFFSRANGNPVVTVRLNEVEQAFCTSQVGGQITYADLTQATPHSGVISLSAVSQLNGTVGRIIR